VIKIKKIIITFLISTLLIISPVFAEITPNPMQPSIFDLLRPLFGYTFAIFDPSGSVFDYGSYIRVNFKGNLNPNNNYWICQLSSPSDSGYISYGTTQTIGAPSLIITSSQPGVSCSITSYDNSRAYITCRLDRNQAWFQNSCRGASSDYVFGYIQVNKQQPQPTQICTPYQVDQSSIGCSGTTFPKTLTYRQCSSDGLSWQTKSIVCEQYSLNIDCQTKCGSSSQPTITTTTQLPTTTILSSQPSQPELKIELIDIAWYKGDTKLLPEAKVLEGEEVSVVIRLKANRDVSKLEGLSAQLVESDMWPNPDDVYNVQMPVFVKDWKAGKILEIRGVWKAYFSPDGWFGLLGDSDWRFKLDFAGRRLGETPTLKVGDVKNFVQPYEEFKWGAVVVDNFTNPSSIPTTDGTSKTDQIPPAYVEKPIEIVDWGFFVNNKKISQLWDNTPFELKVKVRALMQVSGTLKLELRAESFGWLPDPVKTFETKDVRLNPGDIAEISLKYIAVNDRLITAKMMGWTQEYHFDLYLDNEKIFTSPKVKVAKGEVIVVDYGWKDLKNTINEGDTTTAIAWFQRSGGMEEGIGKIIIKREKAWWFDPVVESCQKSLLVSTEPTQLTCTFTPSEANKYHFEVWWNDDKLVDRSQDLCVKNILGFCRPFVESIMDWIARNWWIVAIFVLMIIFLPLILKFILGILVIFKEIQRVMK
jgi:hypothetical protein